MTGATDRAPIASASHVLSFEHLEHLRREVPPEPPTSWTALVPASIVRLVDLGVSSEMSDVGRVAEELRVSAEVFLAAVATRSGALSVRYRMAAGRLHAELGVAATDADQPADSAGGLLTALRAAHVHVELEAVDGAGNPVSGWWSTVAHGSPGRLTEGAVEPGIVHRCLLGLHDAYWCVDVLAIPQPPSLTRSRRHRLFNERRRVAALAQSERAEHPIVAALDDQLGRMLVEADDALSTGEWRVQVVLRAPDAASLTRLGAVWWAATTRGERTSAHVHAPQPQTWSVPPDRWTVLDGRVRERGAAYRHPWSHQIPLPSTLLARLIQPPAMENAGLRVRTTVHFAVPLRRAEGGPGAPNAPGATGAVGDPPMTLGRLVQAERVLPEELDIVPSELVRHVLVAGTTGSGKSTTVRHLLRQLTARGHPWLVLEPVKSEYSGLAAELDARVLRPGHELRLNPLEVPAGTAVHQHVDLIRSVFTVAFGMWTPLPQVLEVALCDVYARAGWDLGTGYNLRDPSGAAPGSWPGLDELADAIDDVVSGLGYEPRITADIRAALSTRLRSLRTGLKGRTYVSDTPFDMDDLLARSAVIGMDELADNDDKAFLLALLMVRLVEARRASGPGPFRHLLVLEEAHRLLGRHVEALEEHADPRAKSAETIAQLLSEIRSFGQGVMVVDQVPSRLVPDAIKNTELKIVHRLVAHDDRYAMGASMAMTDRQAHALSALPVGRAAVFGHQAIGPALVQVPADRAGHVSVALPGPTFAEAQAEAVERQVDLAARDRAVVSAASRFAMSALATASIPHLALDDLRHVVAPYARPGVDAETFLRSVLARTVERLCAHRARQHGWPTSDAAAWQRSMHAVVDAAIGDHEREPAIAQFVEVSDALFQRTADPFPRCGTICGQSPGPCRYRWAARDLRVHGDLRARWDGVPRDDRKPTIERVWDISQAGGWRLVTFPDESVPDTGHRVEAIRASLCYAQQELHPSGSDVPVSSRMILDRLIDRARGTAPRTPGTGPGPGTTGPLGEEEHG